MKTVVIDPIVRELTRQGEHDRQMQEHRAVVGDTSYSEIGSWMGNAQLSFLIRASERGWNGYLVYTRLEDASQCYVQLIEERAQLSRLRASLKRLCRLLNSERTKMGEPAMEAPAFEFTLN